MEEELSQHEAPRPAQQQPETPGLVSDAHRPATAPVAGKTAGGEGGVEDTSKLEMLKRVAADAERELARKTEELRQMEALLADANSSVLATSLANVQDLLHAARGEGGAGGAAAGGAAAGEGGAEPLSVTAVREEYLQRITELEGLLAEASEIRDQQHEVIAGLREDLARDEEIFANKNMETRHLEAQVRDMAAALDKANALADTARAEASQLRAQHVGAGSRAAPSAPGGGAEGARAGAQGDKLSDTLMQQAGNVAIAALVEAEDGVQIGEELDDSLLRPPPAGMRADTGAAAVAAAAAGLRGGAGVGMDEEERRLAEEKRALEIEQDKMARAFHVQQHEAEKKLRDLSFTMKLKQVCAPASACVCVACTGV